MLVADYSLKQLKQCCTQTHCPYLYLYFRQKLRLVHNLPPKSLSVVHMQSCLSSWTPEVYIVEPAQVRTQPIGLIWLWPKVPAHLSRVARVSVIPKKLHPGRSAKERVYAIMYPKWDVQGMCFSIAHSRYLSNKVENTTENPVDRKYRLRCVFVCVCVCVCTRPCVCVRLHVRTCVGVGRGKGGGGEMSHDHSNKIVLLFFYR